VRAEPLRFGAVVNGFGAEVEGGIGPEGGAAGVEIDGYFFSSCWSWG
jgi:hypothetical protein